MDDARTEAVRPGAQLASILERVEMPRKELSLRTGVSEKYIEAVIGGTKEISFFFAARLGDALGLSARYWLDLQAQYEAHRFEQKERDSVQPEELEISLRLLDILAPARKYRLLGAPKDDTDAILSLRKFMGVSDLCTIPVITYTAVYRARHKGCDEIDPYSFLAWQQMCLRLTEHAKTEPAMDIQKLGDSLPAIKHLMAYEEEEIPFHLEKAFAACGIAFRLVPMLDGAPARGYVRRLPDGRGMLCMTARKERQDAFWLALFREISRIVNGNANFIDFFFEESTESYIGNFAEEVLVPAKRYERLVKNGDFSLDIIRRFAESQIVAEHIVLARLLRDGYIEETEEVKAHLPEYRWGNL
ncbi:MAG: hypothetical protein IJ631_04855 [Schwartzia sp.]|nr:hypothetical protein [Schwartzia sp. (in: firmicutes)]